MPAKFVGELKENGQTTTAATFTSVGTDDINEDRPVLRAEAEV